MVQYYLIAPETDPSVIGMKNFQTQAIIERDSFEDKNNYDYLVKCLGSNYYWEQCIDAKDLDVNVERVDVHPDARITDFMRFSPGLIHTYFMVSERIKKIIERISKQGVMFFDTILCYESCVLEYSLMFVESLDKTFIDYEGSIFTTGDEFTGKSIVKITSPEDEVELSKTNYDLSPVVIKFKNPDHFNKDIFNLSGEIFVSDRLMNELSNNQASGVKLLPAYDDVDGRIKII
jgi:hypothetical protein